MNIHLINLDRTPERLESFRRINSHLKKLMRFPAIDGGKLDRDALIADGAMVREVSATYANRGLGNALSHIELWKIAVRSGRPLTTLEDDAIVHRSFEDAAARVVASLPGDWHLILWGWNFDHQMIFNFLPGVSACAGTFFENDMRANWGNFQDCPFHPQAFKVFVAIGTISYTVSPIGARTLLDRVVPLRPLRPPYVNSGIDIAMLAEYWEMNAFACFPPLVITKNEREISETKYSAKSTSPFSN